MANSLDAVDPMVLTLKAAVSGELDRSAIMRFEICIIEVLTNAVEHAWFGEKREPIELFVHIGTNEVIIDVLDPIGAPPFDLREHATKIDQVDSMSESGRGLGLILECANSIKYHEFEGRRRLSLGFRNGSSK